MDTVKLYKHLASYKQIIRLVHYIPSLLGINPIYSQQRARIMLRKKLAFIVWKRATSTFRNKGGEIMTIFFFYVN